MRTETITFNNRTFAVRLLDGKDGFDISIGSEELLDALQANDSDGSDYDFISLEAADIYDEIFFFADPQSLALEDDELIKKLIGDNPDFIEWIG